jgi:hypothetical protein
MAKKRSIDFSEIASTSSATSSIPIFAITPTLSKKKSKGNGGPKKDEIWEYYTQGESLGNGHYKAACHHCPISWARGKPSAMKAHLANGCASCPEDISQYWRNKLANQVINYTRNPRNLHPELPQPKKQQSITQHFGSDKPLPLQTTQRLDCSLLKAWVIAGIPWEIIDNPFIRDLFKDLNPGYIPPSRTTLSGRLLDEEVARVNQHIDQELDTIDHLTLCKHSTFYSIINNLNLII